MTTVLTQIDANHLADAWFAAWNAHDLESILVHYADDIVFASPFVVRLTGRADGELHGKAALRDYFAQALAAYPELRFTPIAVLPGVNGVTLLYRSVRDLLAAEVLEVDASARICRVCCHYTAASETNTLTTHGSTGR